MNLAYIQENWHNQQAGDVLARISAWDSVAEEYVHDASRHLEKDNFLIYLQSKIALTDEMRILDIGCGGGAYSIALGAKVKKVVGVWLFSLHSDTHSRLNPTVGSRLIRTVGTRLVQPIEPLSKWVKLF